MRRFVLAGVVLLAVASSYSSPAQAGTFADCQRASSDAPSLQTCLDDAHRLARKILREANNRDLALIDQHLPERERKALRREYYQAQVSHVRTRDKICGKQRGAPQRLACEADMNTGQVGKLQQIIASLE